MMLFPAVLMNFPNWEWSIFLIGNGPMLVSEMGRSWLVLVTGFSFGSGKRFANFQISGPTPTPIDLLKMVVTTGAISYA